MLRFVFLAALVLAQTPAVRIVSPESGKPLFGAVKIVVEKERDDVEAS